MINRRALLAMAASLPWVASAAAAKRPLAKPAPAREGLLSIAKGRIGFWDTGGRGEAVVLLHPATGGLASWETQRQALSRAGYRVIAYSRRGYAPSDPMPQGGMDEGEDLVAVLDQLGVTKLHLVGVAAGVGVALRYLNRYPERLLSLTLACSLIGVRDPEIEAMMARIRPPGFDALPAEFRELSASYRAADPKGVERWRAIESARPPAFRSASPGMTFPQIAATRVRLMLMTGESDLYAPPSMIRYAATRLPAAKVAILREAGHAIFWEQPTAFNRALLGFLAG